MCVCACARLCLCAFVRVCVWTSTTTKMELCVCSADPSLPPALPATLPTTLPTTRPTTPSPPTALRPPHQVYERAVAQLPPSSAEKRFWRRYIYLWVKYALFEELDCADPDRTRDVYRAVLDLIPHRQFTFAKVRREARACMRACVRACPVW